MLTWLTENELVASGFAELLAGLGENAQGAAGVAAGIVKDYGQAIVGLLGLSFGFYRWWLYREHILHKRLAEYISARDGRLRDVRSQAIEAIQRPAPGQAFDAPLFIDKELRSVLRETRWDHTAVALTVESSSDWQLSSAIESIMRKLQTAEREASSLRQELCTAYSVRGAIAASSTKQGSASKALDHFRIALGLPGHDSDVLLKELEAHQLRKLGHFQAAEAAYERVVALADGIQSDHDRDIIKARAKRYIAEIELFALPKNAYLMLTADMAVGAYAPGALALMERCQPLNAWEFVEKGDTHYLAAFLAHALGYTRAEPIQLDAAAASYRAGQVASGGRRWSTRRLRARVKEGLARVATAQALGTYDAGWLPKSQQPQQPSAKISTAGSDQAVSETA
ncbi:hypothetical protein [Hyphomicrobium sp.]|uniref:hypothetical protein n=1 Tax=Hyphomicrobium sp. TaxID=82 RepID=UPI003F718755